MKLAALTKTMVFLFIIISVINIVSLIQFESYSRELLETSLKQSVYKQLGIDLTGASDLLSEQARYYVQSGNKLHYDAYINEVNNAKTRENVIERLKELGAPQNEIDLVTQAAKLSNTLERLEMEAFEAVANNNFDEARQIMFGERYAEGKQSIIDTMSQYQKKVDQRIKLEAKAMSQAFADAFMIKVIMNTFFMLLIIVSIFIISRFIHKDKKLRIEHETQQKKLEAELREMAFTSHEALSRLSSIYNSIPDTLFCKDINGLYTSCNRSFELQAGMPESEIIGKTYAQIFKDRVTETVDTYKNIDKQIIAECTTNIVEETVIFPDGSSKILETLKAPLIQEYKVVGVLGIGRDVTQYREVKNRLEHIINTAHLAFLLSVDGIIVEANEYSKNNLGVKAGDPIISVYAESMQRETLIKMADSNDKTINVVKFNMINGTAHRFLVNVSPTEYENKNAYILWGIDIEQDEVKNDQIRVMQQSLQTVLDALPIPVRIVDLETNNIVYVNDSFLELLEYSSPDEMCALKLNDILPEAAGDGTPSSQLIDMTVNSENLISFEVDYKTKFGRIIETLLSTRHIEYKGRRSSIGIIKDLTAEKEHTNMLMNAAEREKEANQAKSLFLANMSHEIRTPMNGIIGFSELALDDNITVESKNDYLRKIRSSGEGLLQIVNDILDISKIEAGKIELENIPFNIHDVFRICQTIITPKALEKGIALYCYAEPSVGKKILGDPTRLRQALLNLLSNAVKFTNVGTVKLLSSIIATTDDTVTLGFEIKDSGIGMTPEQIDKVFDAFTQADATTTREYGGTGLGLSITKNIIELMGGKLTVKSAPGIGSKFRFELTFKTIEIAGEIESQDIIINEFEKPTFKGEILLFEDNKINQQVIHDHLERVGIKTIIADNGKIGVDIVHGRIKKGEKPFDLIFMDIHMPVMDGLEAVKKLSEIGNKTPIVALTANVMATSKKLYQEHGIPDYLAKPFKTQELWACLLKYFTPVDFKAIDINEESAADKKQRIQIQTNFVKDNRTTFKDITDAIEKKDIKLAHRIAHTLKGVAGLIGAAKLQEAARVVEYSLSDGRAEPTREQLAVLESELNTILNNLESLLEINPGHPAETLDKKSAAALLDELEPLLAANNTGCMDFIDKLKEIPGTEGLIEQIESFEFKQACETIAEIKRSL